MTLQKIRNVKYIIPYVIRDLQNTGVYLPVTIIFALCVVLIMVMINAIRRLMGKSSAKVLPFVLFFTCLEVILDITILSRSTGDYSVDLGLFATWRHVNSRNKAYVIENIILFVPYGFAFAWVAQYLSKKKRLITCWLLTSMVGLFTSLSIEFTQYITARGHFQVDDLVTNTFGAMVGGFCFAIVYTIAEIIASKRDQSTRKEDL